LGYTEVIEKRGVNGGGNSRSELLEHEIGDDDDFGEEEDEDERRHWKSKSVNKSQTIANGPHGSHLRRASDASTILARQAMRQPGGTGDGATKRDQESSMQNVKPNRARNHSYSDDNQSPHSRSPVPHHTDSRRVPYFRYFGPTAIVPGFKQMVVSVRDRRRSTGGSFSATSPSSVTGHILGLGNPLSSDHELATMDDLPVYDPNNPSPVHPLILNLVKTFFVHFGCNYPFLKEAKFTRQVKEKRVEPILVDAVCALAARFSELPLFTIGNGGKLSRSEYGQVFAQRAKSATVDTFPCPTVGAVQACLLMAYEGFGANQDSALWMYLGLAIRMAVDLGLQTMVGVKYQAETNPWYTRPWSRKDAYVEQNESKIDADGDPLSPEEQREIEQERIDTFWAVFILDRVISSGTGRPVTFRDDDFELALPELARDPVLGWPAPFPTFIRIIHLYGRASDVLNNITNVKDLTQDKWEKLAKIENDLTKLHQRHGVLFTVENFKAYLKAGQGTTFILLHFWFHALIIILHQPTLLTPFGSLSRTHQLLPNSRELSISSAKTIADILAFAELIDPKSYIGNPFTSQPMYIAACAFLMESVANASQPPSRDVTPPPLGHGGDNHKHHRQRHSVSDSNAKSSGKHSLLASAATQNYQQCYNSLQQLNTYWGGVKYILTALDQKSKGIWDCETYTFEEYESTKIPRKGSIGRFARFEHPASPNVPPIAFSLTGTTNSPNSNLTLMYQNMNSSTPQPHSITQSHNNGNQTSAATPPGNMIYDPIRQSLPETTFMSPFPPSYPQPTTSAIRNSPRPSRPHRLSTSSIASTTPPKPHLKYDGMPPEDISTPPSSTIDSNSKVHFGPVNHPPQATFTPSSQHSSGYEPSIMPSASPASTLADPTPGHQRGNTINGGNGGGNSNANGYGPDHGDFSHGGMQAYGYLPQNMGQVTAITDVITFNSHEIDIGALGALPTEMMPQWLEYLPPDMLGLFENGAMGGGG
jgi:hypothetical protein